MTRPPVRTVDFATTLRSTRRLIVAIAAVLVVLTFGVLDAAPDRHRPSAVIYAVIVFAAVYAIVATLLLPRFTKPLAPSNESRTGLGALRMAIFLRFAMAESVALIGLGISIATRNATVYLITMPITVVLLLAVAYPRRATLEPLRRRLESNGVPAGWDASE